MAEFKDEGSTLRVRLEDEVLGKNSTASDESDFYTPPSTPEMSVFGEAHDGDTIGPSTQQQKETEDTLSTKLTMADDHKVTKFLRDLDNNQLIGVGVALGLYRPNLKRMKDLPGDMVSAWLMEDDSVTEASGSPSWASLATALEDIGHKGIASKIRKGPMQAAQTATPLLPPEMSNTFSRYRNYLKSYYNSNPVVHDDKLSIAPCSEFISLALVKKDKSVGKKLQSTSCNGGRNRISAYKIPLVKKDKSVGKKSRSTSCNGGRNRISAHRIPLELDAILTSGNKFVLMEGAPGIGKSTLTWELCRKWDTLKSLQHYRIVLLLKLRERRVQNASSLNELFYHRDRALCESVVSEVLRCEGEGVLLILDGFDEMPATVVCNKESLIMEIISGVCIPRATLVVTSRPSAFHYKKCFPEKLRHVEIIGFNYENIQKFAEIAFESDFQVLSEFKKFILSNPIIKSFMYIPVNCAILAQSYKDIMGNREQVPKTTTQLYTMLTLVLIRRHLIAIGRWNEYSKVPSDLKNLPEDVKGDLERVSKLAYTGLLKQNIQLEFTDNDVGEDFHPLGLLSEVKEMYVCEGARTSYSFLHLSIQEFLAAWHVSNHQELIEDAIAETIYDAHPFSSGPRFSIFGHTLAGLTGVSDLYIRKWGESIIEFFDQCEVVLYVCYCLYEAQSSVSDIFSIFVDGYYNVNLYTPLDMYVFGYCLACVPFTFPWATVMSSIDMLVHSLADHGQLLGSIEMLILKVQNMEESLSPSFKLRDLPYCLLDSIEHLQILTDPSFLLLEGIPFLPYLQEMTIGSIVDVNEVKLFENDYLLESEMSKFPNLESLNVFAKLSERGVCGLIQAIARSSTIKMIELDVGRLCDNDYIFKCRMDSLAQGALSCPSLEYFKTNFPVFIPNNITPQNLHSVILNEIKCSFSELPKLVSYIHGILISCRASPLQSVSFQKYLCQPFLPGETVGGYYDCISLINTYLHHHWPSLETLKLPYQIPCTQFHLSNLSRALRRDTDTSQLKLRRSKSQSDLAYLRPWKEKAFKHNILYDQVWHEPKASQSCPDLLGIQSLHTSFYGTMIVSRLSRLHYFDDLDIKIINFPFLLYSLKFPSKLQVLPSVV